jgi:hypothetical protein
VPVAYLLEDVEAPELLAGVSHHLLARALALVQSVLRCEQLDTGGQWRRHHQHHG